MIFVAVKRRVGGGEKLDPIQFLDKGCRGHQEYQKQGPYFSLGGEF
jgi:hypothetical protein